MARDDGDSGEQGERGEADLQTGSNEPRECMACNGSGQVISNLGGTPSTVSCPWCEGSARRRPDIDAQARWSAHDGGGAGAPEASPKPTA